MLECATGLIVSNISISIFYIFMISSKFLDILILAKQRKDLKAWI